MSAVAGWTARARPGRVTLAGTYCRLEPLDARDHGDDLFAASMAPGAEARFRYLFESPQDRAGFDDWLAQAARSEDPLYSGVIDCATGRCAGRQALMRMTPEHGVIEIGSILWGPAIARTPAATEALYLCARHVFDDLGYRRFEWKCNALNEPSRCAALRFGFTFEGVFRSHMVLKGENRDTAWYSIVDGEWPVLRRAFEAWLDPANFDGAGRQKHRLAQLRDWAGQA